MTALLTLVVCIGLLIAGVIAFMRAVRTRSSKLPGCGMLLAAPILLVVVAGLMPSSPKTPAPAPAPVEPVEQPKSAPTPAPTAEPEPAPTPEPVSEPEPVTTAPSERTDAQNLAIIAGRDVNDPWIAEKLARLDELCPDENASPADMVVNLQQLVKRESGRELTIENVLEQFITAQEGGAEMNMKCSETGGMLATLMIKGM